MEILKHINNKLRIDIIHDNHIAIKVNTLEEFKNIIARLKATNIILIPADIVRSIEIVYNENSYISIDKLSTIEYRKEYVVRYYDKKTYYAYGYTIKEMKDII